MKEKRIRWHWQNLRKPRRLPLSGRAWLYFFSWTFTIEWHLFSKRFNIGVGLDEDATLSLCIPPVSLYLSVSSPQLYRILPNPSRECRLAVHDWAVWLNPWSKSNEWCRTDPLWVRGLTFHVDDFILGKRDYISAEVRDRKRVVIQLDGCEYMGTAKFTRQVWWRPRWLAQSRQSTWIDMNPGHGLPHSGKGESEWNCGDDALCGWGVNGFDVEAAIKHGLSTVAEYRRRYGEPSRTGPARVAS